MIYGVDDATISVDISLRMFGALRRSGVVAEMPLYPFHIREFSRLLSMLAPTLAEITLFLDRTVVDPEKYVRENRELNPFAKA